MTLLQVKDLRTYFNTPSGVARAVDGVSFHLAAGETLAIVGESGCGKTVLANSLMQLYRSNKVVHPTGEVLLEGCDLLKCPTHAIESIRGREMAMIFQEPMTALNPVMKIRDQIAEPLIKHLHFSRPNAYQRALELLERLGIPSPDRVMSGYPHTLSGGMRQRVAIAIALACKPKMLIADEPTTALDVSVQAQILTLIKDMQKELGMSMLIITHDLGVVNKVADRVLVMYSGQKIEEGPVKDVLFSAKHPYTEKLIAAVPSLHVKQSHIDSIEGQVRPATKFVEGCRFAERCPHASGPCLSATPPAAISTTPLHAVSCYLYEPSSSVLRRVEAPKSNAISMRAKIPHNKPPILSLEHVRTWFPVQTGIFKRHTSDVKAVDDVSLTLRPGETLAIVGESGSGKSTLGQTIIRLVAATSGKAILAREAQEPQDLLSINSKAMLGLRSDIQIIFQDPFSSLNPRFSIREIIAEGLKIHKPRLTEIQRDQIIGDILEEVGLPRDSRFRYPHEFSGGQRQRIAIARALVLEPKILILDEATSALDVSIQAQVLNLLQRLQKQHNLAFLFITHNLAVVRQIADHVAVMHLGKVVEYGPTEELLLRPTHTYTKSLLASVLSLG